MVAQPVPAPYHLEYRIPDAKPTLGRLRLSQRKGAKWPVYFWDTSDGLTHKFSLDVLMSRKRFHKRFAAYLPEQYSDLDHYRLVNRGLIGIRCGLDGIHCGLLAAVTK